MARLKTRVDDLEAGMPSKPVMALFEKPGGEAEVYYHSPECAGEPVSSAELASLEQSHVVILVEYRPDDNSLAIKPEQAAEDLQYISEVIPERVTSEPVIIEPEPQGLDDLSSDALDNLFRETFGDKR